MKRVVKFLIYFLILIVIAFFIIGLFSNNQIKKGSLTFTTKWQGEFIDIDGEKIRYLQQGKGPDILLIHGMPGSIEDWQPIIDSLSTNHRITAFDRPANGFSTANNYDYTLKANAILANKLIDTLQLDSVIVVGHSYGGSIAATMATTKNDHIKSFVIVASVLYQFYPETLFKITSAPVVGKGITTLIAKTAAAKKIEEGLLHAFAGNRAILTDGFLATRTQLWSQPKVFYSVSNEQVNYAQNLSEISSAYKNINKKVSILIGDKDRAITIEDCKRLKSEVINAELLMLENTAHYIQFESTDELLKIIKKHVAYNE